MMASYCTRSKGPRPSELAPSECSDVEPIDVAPVAATSYSSPSSTIVRPSVAVVGGPESVSTESAVPVAAPTHSLPAGSHPSSGGLGVLGPAGSPQVGSLPWAFGYPSGLAGPSEIGALVYTVATGIDDIPSSSLAAAPYRQQLASRQPPAAATETAAAQCYTAHFACDSASIFQQFMGITAPKHRGISEIPHPRISRC